VDGVLSRPVFHPTVNKAPRGARMKQLYELEPFIKVKPYLTNQWEKNNAKFKSAS
jgi:hypothetical protein